MYTSFKIFYSILLSCVLKRQRIKKNRILLPQFTPEFRDLLEVNYILHFKTILKLSTLYRSINCLDGTYIINERIRWSPQNRVKFTQIARGVLQPSVLEIL